MMETTPWVQKLAAGEALPTRNINEPCIVFRSDRGSLYLVVDSTTLLPVIPPLDELPTSNSTDGAADYVMFFDASAGKEVKMTIGNFATALGTQPVDNTLVAMGNVVTSADKIIYFTGVDTAAATPLTAAGRALIDDAAASNQRTTLGLTIGTDVEAHDPTLTAMAGVTTATDRIIYFTDVDVAAATPLTAAGRALIDDAAASNQRTTLGLGSAALLISTKLTGTTGAAGVGVDVAHGLTSSKILSVSAVCVGHVQNDPTTGYQFGLSYDATNVTITSHATNGVSVAVQPFIILVVSEA